MYVRSVMGEKKNITVIVVWYFAYLFNYTYLDIRFVWRTFYISQKKKKKTQSSDFSSFRMSYLYFTSLVGLCLYRYTTFVPLKSGEAWNKRLIGGLLACHCQMEKVEWKAVGKQNEKIKCQHDEVLGGVVTGERWLFRAARTRQWWRVSGRCCVRCDVKCGCFSRYNRLNGAESIMTIY